MSLRWQILIATIPHRHLKLLDLLRVLDAQSLPDVRVLVYRDNLEASYGSKLQALMDASTATYVSVLSDDDSVCSDFLPRVHAAMESNPDQIGFRVRYTACGVPQMPVIHSLACGGWQDTSAELRRDIMYFNPIRRELAVQVQFRGSYCDTEWADDLRALGCVKTEVLIDDEVFYYQQDSADNFFTSRQPVPPETILPLPVYPWLDVLA